MTPALSLLFDLDGTLVDTDEHHFGAYLALLGEFGRSVTLGDYRSKIMGAPNDTIMKFLFPDLPASRHRELAERKEDLFRRSLRTLRPTSGLTELLTRAEQRRIPVAVVTNAPRPNAELMLRGLGLDRLIPGLVIGEELERGKPDPLPYVTALARLGGRPDRALAFEDSLSGIRSAVAAGIYTFGIGEALPHSALLGAGASRVIRDFADRDLLALVMAAADGAPIGPGTP